LIRVNQKSRRKRAGYEKEQSYFCPPHPIPLLHGEGTNGNPISSNGVLKIQSKEKEYEKDECQNPRTRNDEKFKIGRYDYEK
jgi:hypothetical protein